MMNRGLKVLLVTLTLMGLMGCANLKTLPSGSPNLPTLERPSPITLNETPKVIVKKEPEPLVCLTPEGYENTARDLGEIRRYIEQLQSYAQSLEDRTK